MERTARRAALLGGAATLLGALALGAGTAPAQAAQTAGAQAAAGAYFSTWATDVNMRYDVNRVNGDRCPESPSPAHCPDVLGRAQPGDRLRVTCQTRGETVGGNPYWVFAHNETRGTYGWMASYFINHPDDVLPGVPTPCYGP
ncbi:hypothetical protein [Streptomyces sp. A012304]|uniref:hypothetical protein n=1 Tax=Streptomyces sp. A012304 TaxID=375446 RepID=UPI00223221F2|nr:hypothetical protein [Streptomyces sp. A012304]